MRAHQTRSYGPNVNTHQLTTDKIRHEQSTNSSIMVAVNGGPSGWRALDWAAAEASAHHSDLRIVHTISWPCWGLDPLGELALDWSNTDAPDRGTQILDEAAGRARLMAPSTTITTHLEAGERAATIVRAGRDVTLIVVGVGQRRRRDRRSVASTVVRLAKRPTAIIGISSASKQKVAAQ
jgi:nucleotide-binding universal stress UspA family protein